MNLQDFEKEQNVERDEIFRRLATGCIFENMGEVEVAMEQLRSVCFFPLMFKSRTTVAAHNRKVIQIINVYIVPYNNKDELFRRDRSGLMEYRSSNSRTWYARTMENTETAQKKYVEINGLLPGNAHSDFLCRIPIYLEKTRC